MVQQLKKGDHLGLVVYDQNVEVLLPLTNMDNEGKDRALFAIKSVTEGGQTNTSGGLLQGLDMIRKRTKPNDVATILLFTDGLANLGLTKPAQIRKAVRGVLGQIDAVCSIFTFGYGAEPDPVYLKEISEEANGVYYHIDTPKAIPLAFSDCLGGLLSVVGQNLVLQIEAGKGATLVDVKTAYKKSTIGLNLVSVTIDDIYSEEEKDILCVIKLPKLQTETAKYEAVEFSLQYTNVLTRKMEYQHVFGTITRPADLIPRVVLPAVDKQRNRLIFASAIQEALVAGQQDNYTAATDVLDKAQKAILTSPTAADNYCQSLLHQLQENQRDVASRENFRKNQARLNTTSISYAQQRSTHSTPVYTTKSKTSTASAYRHFEKDQ